MYACNTTETEGECHEKSDINSFNSISWEELIRSALSLFCIKEQTNSEYTTCCCIIWPVPTAINMSDANSCLVTWLSIVLRNNQTVCDSPVHGMEVICIGEPVLLRISGYFPLGWFSCVSCHFELWTDWMSAKRATQSYSPCKKVARIIQDGSMYMVCLLAFLCFIIKVLL